MKDIRLDNQLLIQECSNIRENLEDILKNINDIEKKFIELTNNNSFLTDRNSLEKVQDIQGRIKIAKQKVLLNNEDKARIGKTFKGDKLPPIKNKKLIPIEGNGNLDILNAEELLKKQKMNTEELMKQQRELDDIQKKYKEFIGEQDVNNNSSAINSQVNKDGNDLAKKDVDKTIITIKTKKIYDGKKGNIKK